MGPLLFLTLNFRKFYIAKEPFMIKATHIKIQIYKGRLKHILTGLFCLAITVSKAGGAGIQFTVNEVGLQTLSYNGQSYISSPLSVGSNMLASALFRTPAGTQNPYGWLPLTLQNQLDISSAVRTTDNASYFQHVYRQGSADEFLIKQVFSTTDSNTLKVDTYITNNDPVDTLAQLDVYILLPFQIPSPANQYNYSIPIDLGAQNQWGGYPVALLSGAWGSIAWWMGDYSGAVDEICSYGSASQTQFNFSLTNYSENQMGHRYEDPIPPGATKLYTTYIRFGSATNTALDLAPEAFDLMRQAYPYLINWPDRRPIARWFVSDGYKTSAVNPRGYFWDDSFDVSDQNGFNTKLLNQADDIVTRMNAMCPQPQGILIWDLEGQEFQQYFTYVGNPPKLGDLSPEMNAIADQLFAKFTGAGYQVGITLRPSSFNSGTTLPATCNYSATPELTDVFIKTDASYPYRGYVCTAANTWTQAGARQPYFQTISDNDVVTLNNLETKVTYARTRWGAKLYYVDSSVYSKGGSLNFNIFRQLQADFPDCLFFPENETVNYYGSTAPYNQANMGSFDTPTSAKDIYPQAFSMLQTLDGVDYSNAAVYDTLVKSVKNGNILFVDGWWDNPQNDHVLNVYRDAGFCTITAVVPRAEDVNLSVFPNPFSKNTKINFTMSSAAEVQLIAYNSIGQKIATIENAFLGSGGHEYNFSSAENGIYFLRILINGVSSTQKLIVTQ